MLFPSNLANRSLPLLAGGQRQLQPEPKTLSIAMLLPVHPIDMCISIGRVPPKV